MFIPSHSIYPFLLPELEKSIKQYFKFLWPFYWLSGKLEYREEVLEDLAFCIRRRENGRIIAAIPWALRFSRERNLNKKSRSQLRDTWQKKSKPALTFIATTDVGSADPIRGSSLIGQPLIEGYSSKGIGRVRLERQSVVFGRGAYG